MVNKSDRGYKKLTHTLGSTSFLRSAADGKPARASSKKITARGYGAGIGYSTRFTEQMIYCELGEKQDWMNGFLK